MARLGVFADLHGNVPALDALLGAFREAGCDRIVFGGDAVGIGPRPRECVERLLDVPGLVAVLGNHEVYATRGLPEQVPPLIAAAGPEYRAWIVDQLPVDLRETVGAWPMAARVELAGACVAVAHYALAPDGRDFLPEVEIQPDGARADELFGPLGAVQAVLYGHTHITHVVRGRALYVNPGSSGAHVRPAARFAVLDVDDGEVDVRLAEVPYDGAALVAALDACDLPEHRAAREIFFPWSLPA